MEGRMGSVMLAGVLLLAAAGVAGCTHRAENPEVRVAQLVEQTCLDVQVDARATFAKITAGEHPYVDKDNPACYVFVYDTDVTIVAHPNKSLVGKVLKGQPDTAGKMFRDEIVAGALKDGSGWIEYMYENPESKTVEKKRTCYKLTRGDDDKQYVVCSGVYED